MIAVVGHLVVDPAQRDRVVDLSREAVLAARDTPGCLHFAVAADPVAEDRVNVSELWVDRDTLERFRGAGPSGELGDLVRDAVVRELEA